MAGAHGSRGGLVDAATTMDGVMTRLCFGALGWAAHFEQKSFRSRREIGGQGITGSRDCTTHKSFLAKPTSRGVQR